MSQLTPRRCKHIWFCVWISLQTDCSVTLFNSVNCTVVRFSYQCLKCIRVATVKDKVCFKTDSNYIVLFFRNRQWSRTMTAQAILRVILGPDSSQRVMVSAGLPSAVTELEAEDSVQNNGTLPTTVHGHTFWQRVCELNFSGRNAKPSNNQNCTHILPTSRPRWRQVFFSINQCSWWHIYFWWQHCGSFISRVYIITVFLARFVLHSPFHIWCRN